MKRKINRVGQNTLTVSLPVEWVKKSGVKAGDSLDLSESGATLILAKESVPAEREIEVMLEGDSERYVRSYVGRLYRNGYSKINVIYDTPKSLPAIKNAVNNLIGADIIDAEMNRCTIRVFPVEDMELDFDKQIIKMLLSLKTLLSITKQDIEKHSFENLDTIDELRHNSWKIRDFILRSAHMNGESYETITDLACMTFCYEKIGSKLVGFYKRYLIKKNKVTNPAKLSRAIDAVTGFVDWLVSRVSKDDKLLFKDESKFRETILNFNVNLINELHDDRNIDHAVLTILYLTSELLDSTVSYLHSYKSHQ
jgi:phosphate uptake regulator